jgi:plasmid stability protein
MDKSFPGMENLSIVDQVKALGGAGRGGGTRKLAEARAAASGKSVSAELRAVQRAVKSGKAPAKQSPKVAKASAGAARAAQIRNARNVHVGSVAVTYPTKAGGKSEGTRDLGDFAMTGDLATAMGEAASLLEVGDEAGARDLMSEALLDEYGDLGGTLEIDDFMDGLRFE